MSYNKRINRIDKRDKKSKSVAMPPPAMMAVRVLETLLTAPRYVNRRAKEHVSKDSLSI
jgi:hypothetical protein